MRPEEPLDRPEEIEAAALGGQVAQHLRAWIAYRSDKYELLFWRFRIDIEVYFVLCGENEIFAIEVKTPLEFVSKPLAFRQDYPQGKAIFLYRDNEKLLKNDILRIPCEKFFKELVPDKNLSTFFVS